MTSEFTIEAPESARDSGKVWGLHNWIAVLAAVGLLVASLLVQQIPGTTLLEGAPTWVFSFMGQISWALVIAAGAVVGMVIGTRILQAHVGTRGARLLAVWGAGTIAVGMVVQSLLVTFVLQPGDAAASTVWVYEVLRVVINAVGALVNIGAVMVALAFVGRLRR